MLKAHKPTRFRKRKFLKPDQRLRIWAHDAKNAMLAMSERGLNRRLEGLPNRIVSRNELRGWFDDPSIRAGYASLHGRVVNHCAGERVNSTPQYDCMILYTIAKAIGASSGLEIGTHLGYSTLHLTAALTENCSEGRMTTVDRFDVNDDEKASYKNYGAEISAAARIALLGLEGNVGFIVSDSVKFLEQANAKFDLIFIDGDHSEVGAYFDIVNALPRLSENGVMLLHDFYDPEDPNPEYSDGQYGVFWALHRLKRHIGDITVLRLGEVLPLSIGGHPPSSIVLLTRRLPEMSR